MTDVVHCPRCGDHVCPAGDDCTGDVACRCAGYVCPDCGVDRDDRPPPTPIPSAGRPVPKARQAGRLVGTLCVLTAFVLVVPPVAGLGAKIVWRLFAFGWGLIP